MKKSQEVSIASPEYRQFIEDLKTRVFSARISAARAVNRDVILLYWDIGRGIVEKQQTLGWGDSIVEMVSADLRQAFPGSFGFSPQNVWRMLQFFRTYTDNLFLSQAVRELEKKGRKTPSPEELSRLVRELNALRTKKNPIGVAVYQLQSKLPSDLKGKLPTAKQLTDVVRSVLPERRAP